MTYPGGKGGAGVAQWIINQMPPHSTYVEAFAGGAAVLRAKKPARSSIVIDADEHVCTALADVAGHGVTVVCGDAISWLESNPLPADALVYCDPPYLRSSRRSARDLYKFEMTDLEHRRLLRCLLALKCFVLVSGYWSSLYVEMLAAWRTSTFQTRTRGGGMATEWLWMNYPEPIELHDYRYLGANFRERERIKRKRNRWLSRLASMPPIERYAMMSALGELRDRLAVGDDAGPHRQE